MINSAGDGLKSVPFLNEYLKIGGKVANTPFNMAHPGEKTLWEHYGKPENAWKMRQFMGAMTDHAKLFKDDIWISGEDVTNVHSSRLLIIRSN